MKFLEIIQQFPKLIDWYFLLSPLKRIQLNYILLLSTVLIISYYNDKQHRENHISYVIRTDAALAECARKQDGYIKHLEYYTDKFKELLDKSPNENQNQK